MLVVELQWGIHDVVCLCSVLDTSIHAVYAAAYLYFISHFYTCMSGSRTYTGIV